MGVLRGRCWSSFCVRWAAGQWQASLSWLLSGFFGQLFPIVTAQGSRGGVLSQESVEGTKRSSDTFSVTVDPVTRTNAQSG